MKMPTVIVDPDIAEAVLAVHATAALITEDLFPVPTTLNAFLSGSEQRERLCVNLHGTGRNRVLW